MLDNLPLIRDVIACRLGRNKIATLNPDMTLDYGLKLPAMGSSGATNGFGGIGMIGSGGDMDIEWIVSASSSSSASLISSARSNKLNDPSMMTSGGGSSVHRSINTSLFNNENMIMNGSTAFSRRDKRLPWDEDPSNGGVKVMRGREGGGVPLKAFPLMDDSNDFLNSNSSNLFRKGIFFGSCSFFFLDFRRS